MRFRKKKLDKIIFIDIHINMALERILRELVSEKGLRKVARDLNIDPASLFRSLQDNSNLKLDRIENLLDYLGYDLKISKRKGVKESKPKENPKKRRR